MGKKGPKAPGVGDADDDRPTVTPPFDPLEFARTSLEPPPGKGSPAAERRSPSILSFVNARPSVPPVNEDPFGDEPPTRDIEIPAVAGGRRFTSASPASELETEMRDRYSLGDYSGALELAEMLIERDSRHRGATECRENCRSVLKQMYTARIGSFDKVPAVLVPSEQLRWLSLNHKAGFILSHVDGISTVDMILDVSGMPELEALKILCELLDQRIIEVG